MPTVNQKPYEILTGVGTLYIAALGATFPDVTATPSTFWTNVGDTIGGVKMNVSQTVVAFRSDQRTGPVKASRTEESGSIETRLANATLETLALLTGNAVSAETSFKAVTLHRGAVVVPMAALYRGQSPYGPFAAQYEVPAGYFDGDITLEHTKEGQVEVPLSYVIIEDPNTTFAGSMFGKLVMQTS